MTKKYFFLLNAYHILVDGLYDSIPILLTFIVIHFGGDEKQIGYIVSCGTLIGTACGICTLAFSQRLAFRKILGFTALLYAVGYLANGFSQGIAWTGVFFVIAASWHSVFHNITFSHISAKIDRKVLGRALSDFTAYGDVGRIPLTALSGYAAVMTIFGMPGWRIVCFAYGMVALIVAAILLLHRTTANTAEPAAKKKRLLPSPDPLRNRRVRNVVLASVVNAFGSDHIFVFLPALLLFKGFDATILGSLALGFTLGCFIGKTLCGRLLDKFGTRPIFVTSEILLAGLLAVLIFAQSLIFVIFIALLIGIVTKGTVPVIQSMLTEYLPTDEHYDDIFILNNLLRGAINIAAPALFGLIGSKFGLNATYTVMAVAAIAAILPLLFIQRQGTN